MRALVAVFLLVAGAAAALADDDYDIKVYPCPLAGEKIKVDGSLSEPAWQKAPLVGGFTYYNEARLAPVQTYFRVLYDRTYLYFGVICDEPLMKKVTPLPQARDSMGVFETEAVEIFIDPSCGRGDYYQLAVNAAGSLYDSRRTDPTWNCDAAAATKPGPDGWTLELAVPWKDLGVEATPMKVIGFNVCRDRLLGEARQWTNWSQTNANFHDPDRFANLVLSPTAEGLGRLGEELRRGGRRGAIAIYSPEGFSQATYRALGAQAVAKLEALLADLDGTRRREREPRAAAELARRLEGFRKECAGFRALIAARDSLDARAWARMSLRMGALTHELGAAIWDARLAALLSEL